MICVYIYIYIYYHYSILGVENGYNVPKWPLNRTRDCHARRSGTPWQQNWAWIWDNVVLACFGVPKNGGSTKLEVSMLKRSNFRSFGGTPTFRKPPIWVELYPYHSGGIIYSCNPITPDIFGSLCQACKLNGKSPTPSSEVVGRHASGKQTEERMIENHHQ